MGYKPIDVEDPREAKLPAWARDMLTNARSRVKEAERDALEASLATGPSESDMIVDRYGRSPIGLGRRPNIRVVLARKADGEIVRWIDVHMDPDGDGIEVRGDATLRITPQVTNVIAVTTTRGSERGII